MPAILSRSAVRPAVESAEYTIGSSAARPAAHDDWRRLAFYNIGWQETDKKHTMTWLPNEIYNIVNTRFSSDVFSAIELYETIYWYN